MRFKRSVSSETVLGIPVSFLSRPNGVPVLTVSRLLTNARGRHNAVPEGLQRLIHPTSGKGCSPKFATASILLAAAKICHMEDATPLTSLACCPRLMQSSVWDSLVLYLPQ